MLSILIFFGLQLASAEEIFLLGHLDVFRVQVDLEKSSSPYGSVTAIERTSSTRGAIHSLSKGALPDGTRTFEIKFKLSPTRDSLIWVHTDAQGYPVRAYYSNGEPGTAYQVPILKNPDGSIPIWNASGGCESDLGKSRVPDLMDITAEISGVSRRRSVWD